MNARDLPKGRRRAASLLAVITPVIAELTLGNPPLSRIWLMLLWIPIYGAGTVLIRELVRRRRGGWPSILLLGLAYGIVEEGLVLQALSSPTMYGVAGWAPRFLGINSAYAELNLVYHAVFSVALPILLADLVFPSLRDRPYLKRTGVVVAGVVFVLGGLLLRVTVATSIDPGYQAPVTVPAGCVAAVALLAVVALRVLPPPALDASVASPSSVDGTRAGAVPGSWAVGGFGVVAGFGYLALLFPFGGADQPAFTHGGWVAAPMLGAAVLAVVAGWLVRRWTASGGWTDRHGLCLAGGALVGHTAFGVVANAATLADKLELSALGLVTVGLLALLGRRRPAPARTR
ncbi:hypothetical protein Skr01_03340 [Sphaerisporangium krabiense]|uniref:Uncharacterized protein n=1 Tax=Sphaerisporangium krabiense TaxID=763782 RepID=A0A7W8Z7T4_9ACTN|nr:hypothetical protein [Sphaerisporangium krabiense]MBB5628910.1 hypothetical protein [Sphaerisporangium krabiense]GII60249.1 hypothetical protein Skr01_03340 [Sphaerisporangium krabiense]